MINLSLFLGQKFNDILREFIIHLYITNEDFANSLPESEIIEEIKSIIIKSPHNKFHCPTLPENDSEYIQIYLEDYVNICNKSVIVTSKPNLKKKKKEQNTDTDNLCHYVINLPQIAFYVGKKYSMNFPWNNMEQFAELFLEYYHKKIVTGKNTNITMHQLQSLTYNNNGCFYIKFKKSFLMSLIYDLSEFSYKLETDNPEKIVVDFSSPNMAKIMHLGHLRSTIIGDVIARFFEFLGHNVKRINHLGDWGRPFAVVIAYLLEHKEEYDNSPTAKTLLDFYIKGTEKFSNDHKFENIVYDILKKLQNKESEIYKLWQDICYISRSEYQNIYDELNIKITDMGESTYQDTMNQMIKELEKNKHLTNTNGMKVIMIDNMNIPLIIQKSDVKGGNYTYDTTDLAALKYRIETMKASRIYYVVGTSQSQHFQLLFEAGKKVGYYNHLYHYVEHIGFGLVKTPSGTKLSSRKGTDVSLQEILELGKEYAKKETIKKQSEDNFKDSGHKREEYSDEYITDMSTKLSTNCIKYFELSHKRTVDYKIDYDKLFNNKGNTAVYINYSYVRLYQIWTKFKELHDVEIDSIKLMSQNETDNQKYKPEEIEVKLMLQILKFPEMIHLMEYGMNNKNGLMPHNMTDYLYDLAQLINKFYTNPKCYCLESNDPENVTVVSFSRILLVIMTLKVMKTTLDILGIETITKI